MPTDQIPCSHCLRSYNRDLPACPFCGGENPRGKPVPEVLHCPRCRKELERREFRQEELDVCPKCAGFWLDTDEFHNLSSERDVYTDDSIPRRFRKAPVRAKDAYLPCPVCGDLMTRKNFKTISGVLIDLCRHHGVWLDAGELDQIRCFIANGGLQEYQDKRIAANREKIEVVADRLSGVEFTQWFLNKWKLKYMLKEGILPKKRTM